MRNANENLVRDWLAAQTDDGSMPSLLASFEEAWRALWLRAEGSIGQVALESLAALVRAGAVKRHPFLGSLEFDGAAASCRGLLESPQAPPAREVQEGLVFVLAHFMTVIGDMTDQILTPGLRDALARIQRRPEPYEKPRPAKRTAPAQEDIVKQAPENRIKTGIQNLDEMLDGGLIRGSSVAVAGPPGAGKTILAQQIAFRNAAPKSQAVCFSTLSEPGAKTLFYLNQFDYCDPAKIGESVHFVDLGILLRTKGLSSTQQLILEHLDRLKPTLVVIDSFKAFADMGATAEELRKFTYELIVTLMTRECTSLLLGEFSPGDFLDNPLFSIIDGLIVMSQREASGEEQRFIQVVKMRGLAHSRDEHTFRISKEGVEVFAPRLTIKRISQPEPGPPAAPCKAGIPKFDELLGAGIPRGSSLLLSGVAGTGKTVLSLEFLHRGALAGEKGICFSFEETEARLRAEAAGLGWDLDAQISKGLIEIVFIPQPDILVEHHLLMMQERIEKLGAARVVVDSLSVFLHKIKDPQIAREKVFQLASIVQKTGAVALFATDVPYGSAQISRFGVEETVVDGVIILSATSEGLERQRYIEVYKLRNTAHLKGRHSMVIDDSGIKIFPRYRAQTLMDIKAPPAKVAKRLSSGVPGFDALMGGGLMARSLTLVSGSSGIGKSILSLQFLLEGAARGENGLYVTLEEGPEELMANAAALGMPLKQVIDGGLLDIVYLPPTHIRSTQLLAVLTDRIRSKKTRRLVLDSATHIVASGMSQDDIRELLYDLVVRFKSLGVTSYFTLESGSMYSTETTERGFTPLADNVVMLRYAPVKHGVVSTFMVVKTRGSDHDKGLYALVIGKGGLRLGAPVQMPGATSDQPAPAARAGRKH